MNLISFDIEEWFIEKKFNGARQDKYVQYDAILSRILDLLEEKECKCNKQILNRHFSVKLNRHMIFETLRL